MNVYDVIANGRIICVVAESMGEAEKILLKIYDTATIDRIELHAEDVILQENKEEKDEKLVKEMKDGKSSNRL